MRTCKASWQKCIRKVWIPSRSRLEARPQARPLQLIDRNQVLLFLFKEAKPSRKLLRHFLEQPGRQQPPNHRMKRAVFLPLLLEQCWQHACRCFLCDGGLEVGRRDAPLTSQVGSGQIGAESDEIDPLHGTDFPHFVALTPQSPADIIMLGSSFCSGSVRSCLHQ